MLTRTLTNEKKVGVLRVPGVAVAKPVEVERGERLGEDAGDDLALVDEEFRPEDLVELAPDRVRCRSVRRLAILGQFECLLVDLNSVDALAGHPFEFGFGSGELAGDAILLGLQELDRDRVVVVGLEELATFGTQIRDALVEPLGLACRPLGELRMLASDLVSGVGDLLLREVDDGPVISDRPFQ